MMRIKKIFALALVVFILGACSHDNKATTYTVTWKNWDGSVLEEDTGLEIGTLPSYDGNTPTRPDSDRYTFYFTRWQPNVTKVTQDAVYVAMYGWKGIKHNLSVTSNDASKGTVAITRGTGCTDESITVEAYPNDGCSFEGWYLGSSKVSNKSDYTFIMPNNDVSLIAYFDGETVLPHPGAIPVKSDTGDTITYGLYPQKNINNSSLIASLNSLKTPEPNGWYLYNNDYYAKTKATPYESNSTFDNGTKIISGSTYWFKCEPIVWDIYNSDNDSYCVFSAAQLDVHCYYSSTSNRRINGQIVYPNNYMHSDVRAWLNGDFYNSAFVLGSNYVQMTVVDNSVPPVYDSTYACEDTEDKVFLPKSYEFLDKNRKVTDWARARGIYVDLNDPQNSDGYSWSRTPSGAGAGDMAMCVNSLGNGGHSRPVVSENISISPAITIKLQ